MEYFVPHSAINRALIAPFSPYLRTRPSLAAPSSNQAAMGGKPVADGSKWNFEPDRQCRILTKWSSRHVA
jgi:hypothetical protein